MSGIVRKRDRYIDSVCFKQDKDTYQTVIKERERGKGTLGERERERERVRKEGRERRNKGGQRVIESEIESGRKE